MKQAICGTMFLLALSPLNAQLYLIKGSPTRNTGISFGSSLLMLGADGQLLNVVDLVSPALGTLLITVDDDDRIAVLVTQQKGGSIEAGSAVVVDLKKAAVVKECVLPATPLLYSLSEWLSDVPSKGLTLNVEAASVDLNPHLIEGMSLDTSTSCEQSFRNVDWSELRYTMASGRAGVAGASVHDGMDFNLDESSTMGRIVSKVRIPFGGPIPVELLNGQHFVGGIMIANTRAMMILVVTDYKGHSRILALRKRDQNWREVHVQEEGSYSCFRAFGNFVVAPESRKKNRPEELGPGEAEWKRTNTTGPDMLEKFKEGPAVYPGRLDIYNIETEKTYQVVTDQADSEVILIEGGIVYYRVNDRLYSAPLTDKGLGNEKLLATDELIRDAHWAFTKH
jgi:hypothetical protein